ncbi:hypothetical protein Efla_003358 [Eimeria flavescens]
MIDPSNEAVPREHLPLSVGDTPSRQQTEELRSFPRAFTCPTYRTGCQPQQHQQQQQQQQRAAAAAGDVVDYLGYAMYINEATSNPFRGPPEVVGQLSVLGVDTAAAGSRSSSGFTCSSCTPAAYAAPDRKPDSHRRRKPGGSRFCCGLLD